MVDMAACHGRRSSCCQEQFYLGSIPLGLVTDVFLRTLLLYCGRDGSRSFHKSLLGLLPVLGSYLSECPGDALASTSCLTAS